MKNKYTDTYSHRFLPVYILLPSYRLSMSRKKSFINIPPILCLLSIFFVFYYKRHSINIVYIEKQKGNAIDPSLIIERKKNLLTDFLISVIKKTFIRILID